MSAKSDSKSEPISKEFKEEIITRTIRDITNGSISVYLIPEPWSRDVYEQLRKYSDMLFPKMLEYISGTGKGEENKELVDELFRAIFVLRGKQVIKGKSFPNSKKQSGS